MHIFIPALCKIPTSSKQNIFSDQQRECQKRRNIKICCDLSDLSVQPIDEICLFSVMTVYNTRWKVLMQSGNNMIIHQIVCFTSFKDQFNLRKWKQSLKVQNFEVVNSAICAIFTLCNCKNLAAARWSDFPSQKFYFEIFSKTKRVSITFGLRYIMGKV